MNKYLKKIIAITLVVSAFSAITPATSFNLLTEEVYAASSNSEKYLDSLGLLTSEGSIIKLYDNKDYKSSGRVVSEDVEAGEIYYATTSADTISVDVDGPGSKYVRVFKGTSDSTKGKSASTDVRLLKDSMSSTIIVVKVYGKETDDNIRYDDDDEYDLLSTYKIKVEYSGSDENKNTYTENANAYDDIYLDNLSVNGENIPVTKSKIKYTYDVAADIDEATIKVKPENDDYSVVIEDDYVDVDDKYKKTVNLFKGENKFEIEIQDSNKNIRVYTLIINKGTTSSVKEPVKTPNTPDTTAVSTVKTNQWVQVNGQWQYIDETGKVAKSRWIENCFVQPDGNMATGWLNYSGNWYYLGIDGTKKTDWQSVDGSWYYLGTDGAKKINWQLVDGKWYYLDPQGKMQIGWINLDRKWYYLNDDGSMAYNTKVGAYKLGASGIWIK